MVRVAAEVRGRGRFRVGVSVGVSVRARVRVRGGVSIRVMVMVRVRVQINWPQAMCLTWSMSETRVGRLRLESSPMPSWPLVPLPHA